MLCFKLSLGFTFVGFSVLMSSSVSGQIVCQVIEPIECPAVAEANCPDLVNCVFVGGGNPPECGDVAVRAKNVMRDSVRPANFQELGFFFANHVGTINCEQERECHTECEDVGEFFPIWKCKWDVRNAWIDAGDDWVDLQGANPCAG